MGALQDVPNNPWGALVTTTEDAAAADNDPSLPCRTSTERIDELEAYIENLEAIITGILTALTLRVDDLESTREDWTGD